MIHRLFLLVLCVAAACRADMLNMDACLNEAARSNPSLASQRAALDKSHLQFRGTISPFLPQASASAGRTRSGRDTDAGLTTSDDSSIGLSAQQTLFAGGQNTGRRAQNRAALDSSMEDLRSSQAQVTYDVRAAFARLLFAQDSIRLAETIVASRLANAQLIELRYEGGREHKGSLLRVQAAHRQAQSDLSQARRNSDVARRQLARVIGRLSPDLSATGRLEVAELPPAPDLGPLVRQTPDYGIAAAQVRAAEASLTVARSAYYPDVSAGASLSRSGTDWPTDESGWALSLKLSYPFFPGGRNYYDVQGARAELRRARSLLTAKEGELAVRLDQAYADLADAADQVRVQQQYLEAARVRAEIARTQYASGMMSFEDWDPIENDLIDKQTALLQSQRNAVIAEAQWDNVRGVSLLPPGGDPPDRQTAEEQR